MSVAAFNKFALLNDDADGGTPPAAAASKAKAQAAATPAPPAPATEAGRGRGGPASRSGRYPARGGGPPSKPSEPRVTDDSAIPPARFDRTEGRRDRGRGRGAPRTGGAATRDRHSRTAIVDSEKQINQGWGADTGRAELGAEAQAEADAAAEAAQTPAAEGTGASWGEEAGASWGAAGDDAAPTTDAQPAADGGEQKAARLAPEEDKTLTLDEYLASKNSNLSDLISTPEGRQVSEGEAVVKGATKFARDEDDQSYFVGTKNKAPKAKAKADKPEKVTIEIDGQFSEPPGGFRGRGRGRGRGDFRGGRGEGRGEGRGRGRGGFRGGYQNGARGPQVDVADENAFPSLDKPQKKKE